MHSQIPHSELVILSPAGHQGLVERHAESNEAARRLWKSLGEVFFKTKFSITPKMFKEK
ncbi:MAG: hypothetical protein INR73_18105 [Williamsia sp.]|nr:hypothetical protein [Williamsia sp.]